jgi:hypothetical protein
VKAEGSQGRNSAILATKMMVSLEFFSWGWCVSQVISQVTIFEIRVQKIVWNTNESCEG